ncbi:MAG: hypothetical protein GF311_17735 [Candidatus Lokiarchaeota archaeon]|nr:hypothetical protein [Candidatus Lokiarchaeota archaeon]
MKQERLFIIKLSLIINWFILFYMIPNTFFSLGNGFFSSLYNLIGLLLFGISIILIHTAKNFTFIIPLGIISTIIFISTVFHGLIVFLPSAPLDIIIHNNYYIKIPTTLIPITAMIIVYSFLIALKFNEKNIDLLEVRKCILELGTKFTRLSIEEISEVTGLDRYNIENLVVEMVKNKDIYAKYFKSTKMVAFDQQSNIEEIHHLMQIYDDWGD